MKAKAAIKALVKAGSSTVTEIEREAERRPMVLQEAVQDIIRACPHVLSLQARGYRRLVIIADGLEKIQPRQLGDGITAHTSLFINNSNRFSRLPATWYTPFPWPC